MKKRMIFLMTILSVICQTTSLNAEDQRKDGTPQTETGSSDILIEGKQAKRAGDISPDDAIYSQDVFFNGKPAIIGCRKGIPVTSSSVIINGKPAVLGCKK